MEYLLDVVQLIVIFWVYLCFSGLLAQEYHDKDNPKTYSGYQLGTKVRLDNESFLATEGSTPNDLINVNSHTGPNTIHGTFPHDNFSAIEQTITSSSNSPLGTQVSHNATATKIDAFNIIPHSNSLTNSARQVRSSSLPAVEQPPPSLTTDAVPSILQRNTVHGGKANSVGTVASGAPQNEQPVSGAEFTGETEKQDEWPKISSVPVTPAPEPVPQRSPDTRDLSADPLNMDVDASGQLVSESLVPGKPLSTQEDLSTMAFGNDKGSKASNIISELGTIANTTPLVFTSASTPVVGSSNHANGTEESKSLGHQGLSSPSLPVVEQSPPVLGTHLLTTGVDGDLIPPTTGIPDTDLLPGVPPQEVNDTESIITEANFTAITARTTNPASDPSTELNGDAAPGIAADPSTLPVVEQSPPSLHNIITTTFLSNITRGHTTTVREDVSTTASELGQTSTTGLLSVNSDVTDPAMNEPLVEASSYVSLLQSSQSFTRPPVEETTITTLLPNSSHGTSEEVQTQTAPSKAAKELESLVVSDSTENHNVTQDVITPDDQAVVTDAGATESDASFPVISSTQQHAQAGTSVEVTSKAGHLDVGLDRVDSTIGSSGLTEVTSGADGSSRNTDTATPSVNDPIPSVLISTTSSNPHSLSYADGGSGSALVTVEATSSLTLTKSFTEDTNAAAVTVMNTSDDTTSNGGSTLPNIAGVPTSHQTSASEARPVTETSTVANSISIGDTEPAIVPDSMPSATDQTELTSLTVSSDITTTTMANPATVTRAAAAATASSAIADTDTPNTMSYEPTSASVSVNGSTDQADQSTAAIIPVISDSLPTATGLVNLGKSGTTSSSTEIESSQTSDKSQETQTPASHSPTDPVMVISSAGTDSFTTLGGLMTESTAKEATVSIRTENTDTTSSSLPPTVVSETASVIDVGTSTASSISHFVPVPYQMRMTGIDWDESMTDPISWQFKKLYSQLEPELDAIFRNVLLRSFKGNKLESFSEGSVVIHGTATSGTDMDDHVIATALRKEMKKRSYKLGGYNVDKNSLKVGDAKAIPEKRKSNPNASSGLPVWAVGVIVAICFLLLVLIVISLIMYSVKQRKRTQMIREDNEYMEDAFTQNGSVTGRSWVGKPQLEYPVQGIYEMKQPVLTAPPTMVVAVPSPGLGYQNYGFNATVQPVLPPPDERVLAAYARSYYNGY